MVKAEDPTPSKGQSDRQSGMTERELDSIDEDDVPSVNNAGRRRMRKPKPKPMRKYRRRVIDA